MIKTERYSYSGGRRTACSQFGLKPAGSGCTSALRSAGWSKDDGKDAALDILCDAGILSGADCSFYRAGGEAPKDAGGGMDLGKIFLWIIIMLVVLIAAAVIYKRVTKKKAT